jgi:hypothetical protein
MSSLFGETLSLGKVLQVGKVSFGGEKLDWL